MWLAAADPLLEIIKSEPEPDIVCKLVEALYTVSCVCHYLLSIPFFFIFSTFFFLLSFRQSLDTMGENCLDQTRLATLADALISQVTEAFNRAKERRARRADEDYDEEVEETLEGEQGNDEYTLKEIGEAIHYTFKTHRETFLPHFEGLIPLVVEFLVRFPLLHSFSLCFFFPDTAVGLAFIAEEWPDRVRASVGGVRD